MSQKDPLGVEKVTTLIFESHPWDFSDNTNNNFKVRPP